MSLSPLTKLAHLERAAAQFRPRKKWYRHFFCHRSAVAVIVREGERGLEALMIERAEREGDPWSGHMAFPGGRMDGDDRHSLAAAQRETLEEIGLPAATYSQCITRLSDIVSSPHRGRRPMVISCYLFTIEQLPTLSLNHEVADTLWVPLSFLADSSNRKSMQWQPRGRRLTMSLPCYFYSERRIWGLSLLMLDELLALFKKID